MNSHTRKTYDAILGEPAPRDLEWRKFVTLWKDIADAVSNESGDRLSVAMHGHREVFRRPHDGRVSIEDVERARHLLADTPSDKGSGRLLVVTIDDREARILDFDLDVPQIRDTEQEVRDHDARSHHLRTVERHAGHDDIADLNRFFDELADSVRKEAKGRRFVVLGHGHGKADAAAEFVHRLRAKHHDVGAWLAGVGSIDLSAANDAEIEAKAQEIVRRTKAEEH